MSVAARRLIQAAIALALASAVVLVTQWAYPIGHLAIHLGHPRYSRYVGESDLYVSIDVRLQNVGVDPVRVDREHFLLVDDQGHIYKSDVSSQISQFEQYHAAISTIMPLHDLRGRVVFRIPSGRTASKLLFVTTTGEIVHLRLS